MSILFNHADLPIAGFLTHVFYARYIGIPPRWSAAVIDLFGGLLKSLAPSAASELARLDTKTLPVMEFTEKVAGEIRTKRLSAATRMRPMPEYATESDLRESYDALAAALLEETGIARGDGPADQDGSLIAAVRKAAEEAQSDAGPGARDTSQSRMRDGDLFGSAARTMGWGFLMARSRREHLAAYLARFVSDDRAPRRVTALLVDYDYWLDDHPKAGSAPLDQIKVMHRIRQIAKPRVVVEVFAGVCPLRLAIETAKRCPRLFDDLKSAHRDGLVQGFKLYPPMGFRPWGNSDLGDADFDPPPAWRRTAADLWREASPNSPDTLGQALDSALAEIYSYAASASVPVVAHAGPGNQAGPAYGKRASPEFWEKVVEQYPIRLSLGHLVNEAGPFITAVAKGPPYPDCIWALHGSLRMLDRRPNNAPDVYGDLAYMPELIDDAGLARDFFAALAMAFGPGDPELTRIVFGTDWIMLGRERHNSRFLRAVEKGIHAANYTPTQMENVLFANGNRFLAAPTATSTGGEPS